MDDAHVANGRARRQIVLSGLPSKTTDDVVQAACVPYGEIGAVRIMGTSATVTFEDAHDANEARRNLHRAELFGRTIRVQMAGPTTSSPDGEKRKRARPT